MTGTWKILITLTIVLTPTVFAIKCWTCRSDIDTKCGETFDNSTLLITDCDRAKGLPHLPASSPSMCRKIKQKVNGEWTYIRDCAYRGEVTTQEDERISIMQGTHDIEYSTCNDKDGCNSSYMNTPTPFMLILLIGFCGLLKCIS